MVVMEETGFSSIETMDLSAGEPVLDFVNTGSRLLERHADLEGEALEAAGPFGDRLGAYADLVTFGERAGLVSGELGAALRKQAAREPAAAAAVLGRARAFREALFRVFGSPAEAAVPGPSDLAQLHEAAAAAAARQRLVRSGDGYELVWGDEPELERVLWPLATSAVSLLVSGELDRVKECAAHDCHWLFLDSSRNRSRRWCDMKACGNRAKARQFYQRHQSG
jgi:predicted RNA-binding Zn ribbon-like protein